MTPQEFNAVVDNRLEQIKKVLSSKGKEYGAVDRLHNFKVGARILGSTQSKALLGMMNKHLVSVMDMINGDLEVTNYMVNEKIGDAINYLILLEAVFIEELTDAKARVANRTIGSMNESNKG